MMRKCHPVEHLPSALPRKGALLRFKYSTPPRLFLVRTEQAIMPSSYVLLLRIHYYVFTYLGR
jgi:hypothetical protein